MKSPRTRSRTDLLFCRIALLGLGGFLPHLASAQVLNYPDFSNASLTANPALTLNGNAAITNNLLELTPATFSQDGSTFSTGLIPLNNQESFSTAFSFRLSNPGGIGDEDGVGADGIVFAVQTVSNTVGNVGGGLGYQGLSPSVGIAFDTYNNHLPLDLDGNHVSIDKNGDINYADTLAYKYAPTGGSPGFPTRFNNGSIWYAWVDYNGATQNMDVRYSSTDVRPTDPFISANLDLASILGQSSAYVGFTGSTGAGYQNQDILSWQFKNTYSPIGVPQTNAVPESAPLTLVILGLLPLGLVARRKTGRSQG